METPPRSRSPLAPREAVPQNLQTNSDTEDETTCPRSVKFGLKAPSTPEDNWKMMYNHQLYPDIGSVYLKVPSVSWKALTGEKQYELFQVCLAVCTNGLRHNSSNKPESSRRDFWPQYAVPLSRADWFALNALCIDWCNKRKITCKDFLQDMISSEQEVGSDD